MQPLEEDEDLLLELRCDADAVVADGELPHAVGGYGADVDVRRPVGAPELDGVRQQVLPEHAQLGGVPHDRRQHVVGDLGPTLLDGHAEVVEGLAHHLLQIDGLVLVVHAADPGECQQVVDEDLHTVGAVDGEGDVLVGPLVQLAPVAPLQELGEAGHLAQRFLQVVRGDVGELFQLRVRPLQVRRLLVQQSPGRFAGLKFLQQAPAHRLDVRCQLPQVGGALADEGQVEAALRHVARVGAEQTERTCDAAP